MFSRSAKSSRSQPSSRLPVRVRRALKTNNEISEQENDVETDRRTFLKAGAGVVAASLLSTDNAVAESSAGAGPYEAKAYGASSATSPLKEISIERRALGANDVLLDILYCGVCHSD